MFESQADPASPVFAPLRVGPYEILGEIDNGGQGRVFRARDTRLHRIVAVKLLHGAVASDPERRRRLLDEARATCRLSHPNILTVHDAGEDGGQAYVVTELIDGRSLKDELDGGPMPVARVLDLATQIADGLAAAHRVPIVHRDLKPGNVMIASGRAVIIDFGLATGAGDPSGTDRGGATVTAAHAILGTPPYMSPEQARGRAVDYRSDLFAFGSMVYEMATGRRAFDRATAIETLTAIQHDEPPPLRELNPRLPGRLQDIVQRCLAKLPEDRYGSTADLVHDLRALRDGRVPTDSALTVAGPATAPWWRTAPARLGLGVAAALVTALAFALALAGPPAGRDLGRYRIVPVATDTAYEGAPAWSPDGQTLAYIAERDGVMQVMARNLASPRAVPLTRAVADCRNPMWSPDGSRVYYLSLAGNQDSLWSVSAAGGNAQLELRDVAVATLSPDGRALVFLRDEGAYQMAPYVSAPVGQPAVPFGARPWRIGGISTLRFSPDGSQIAFWINSLDDDDPTADNPVFIVADYPSGKWREVPALGDVSRPHPFAWLPDGRRIVFGADLFGRSPGTHLWVADTITGALEGLTASSTAEYEPAVSPDGRSVAFVAEASHYDVIEIPVDGRPVIERRANASDDSDPVWSPTGRQYAYVTNRSGEREIWLSDPDGTVELPLVVGRAFATVTSLLSRPAFSPDGQRLVYQRRDAAGYTMWATPTAGGSPVQVMPRTVAGYQDSPTWSPNGDWLAFTYIGATETGSWRLGKTRPGANGEVVELRRDINFLSNPQWSPDGAWITVELQDGLYAVSPDGPAQRLISRDPWIVHAWSPDSTHLYAIRQSDDNRLQLAAIDVATQAVRIINPDLGPVPPTTPPLRGFSLSPDGTRLLTSMARLRGDIHVLDGFERRDGWRVRLARVLAWAGAGAESP